MADEFELEYISPWGEKFRLIRNDRKYRRAFIEQETIEGLVGVFEDSGVQVPGRPGQVYHRRDVVIQPLTGTFVAVAMSREQYAEFYAAWSTSQCGTLRLVGRQVMTCRVRLAEELPSPARVPRAGARVSVSVVADSGVWEVDSFGTGAVTVTNWGVVPVWPEITWEGAGGRVTLPSGAGFTLPAVSARRVLPLDRMESGFVRDEAGVVDRQATAEAGAVGEMVPVGESRTFTVPAGAVLRYRIGVLNPWREK